MAGGESEYRKVRVPPHRLTPLRQQWAHLMQPVVEHLLLQIRYNPKNRSVELKTSEVSGSWSPSQSLYDRMLI